MCNLKNVEELGHRYRNRHTLKINDFIDRCATTRSPSYVINY